MKGCWKKMGAGALVIYLLMALYYNTLDARKWFREKQVEGIDLGAGNPNLFGNKRPNSQ